MRGRILELAIVAAAAAVLAGFLVDHFQDRRHTRQLAEANNRLVAAEETRQVAEGTWMRRMYVVTEELRMQHLDRLGALEELERAGLEARALYNLALDYRAQLTGTSQAVAGADSADTVIPIDVADGNARARGDVTLRGHHVPASVPIEVAIEIMLRRLMLALAIGEDPETGGLIAQATTDDPHVGAIEIEGITDLRSTGIGEAGEGPSRLKWGTIGAVAGALACLFWCPTP